MKHGPDLDLNRPDQTPFPLGLFRTPRLGWLPGGAAGALVRSSAEVVPPEVRKGEAEEGTHARALVPVVRIKFGGAIKRSSRGRFHPQRTRFPVPCTTLGCARPTSFLEHAGVPKR